MAKKLSLNIYNDWRTTMKLTKTLTTASLMVLCISAAMAADTSTSTALPYETWLKTIQKSLTGPVAMSISLMGMVSAGASLIFLGGEFGRFMRTVVYLVFVMALLLGANSFMTNLFNGASLSDPIKDYQSTELSLEKLQEKSFFQSLNLKDSLNQNFSQDKLMMLKKPQKEYC